MGTSKKKYITPEEYDIAAKHGISEEAVNVRVRRLDWDIEKAITEPIKQSNKLPDYIIALARKNGVYNQLLHARLRNKWDMYEAAITPVTKKKRSEFAVYKGDKFILSLIHI